MYTKIVRQYPWRVRLFLCLLTLWHYTIFLSIVNRILYYIGFFFSFSFRFAHEWLLRNTWSTAMCYKWTSSCVVQWVKFGWCRQSHRTLSQQRYSTLSFCCCCFVSLASMSISIETHNFSLPRFISHTSLYELHKSRSWRRRRRRCSNITCACSHALLQSHFCVVYCVDLRYVQKIWGFSVIIRPLCWIESGVALIDARHHRTIRGGVRRKPLITFYTPTFLKEFRKSIKSRSAKTVKWQIFFKNWNPISRLAFEFKRI